jgi:protein-tyrosine phosphatase
MSFIIDRLYIGNINDAQNYNFISQNGINVIVNCSKDIPNYFQSNPEINYYRLPVDDNLEQSQLNLFDHYSRHLLPRIYQEYINGKTILIHCFAGMQRSAAFALLFLIYLYKKNNFITMSVKDAQFLLTSRRPLVFNYGISMNFEMPVYAIANDIALDKL